MSIFICYKCGCVDNTATSSYWALMRAPNEYEWCEELAQYKGKPLCSECGYVKYDGKDAIVVPGKWHNKFDKKEATEKDKRNIGRNGIIQ